MSQILADHRLVEHNGKTTGEVHMSRKIKLFGMTLNRFTMALYSICSTGQMKTKSRSLSIAAQGRNYAPFVERIDEIWTRRSLISVLVFLAK